MGTRRLRAAAQLAAAGAALAASLTACSSGGSAGQPSNLITVSSNQCGGAWQLPGPGRHTFEIYNQSIDGGEIDLVNPANGAVYAELENSGPGTTNAMTLDVGSGRYAFLCLFSDYNPLQGAVVTVSGHAAGTPAILPITDLDIIPIAKDYQAYAETGLQVLARQTAALAADVRAGHLAAAKRDWLTAHLRYQTLGAAYDSFGDYDDGIDGRADAVGVASPQWTGFYRLEYGPTAIFITYDDSDGWYDHQAPTIIEGSNASVTTPTTGTTQIDTAMCTEVAVTVGTAQGRCGFSQRLPMIVISPYTRENYVSDNLTDTTSVVKFIEDNWLRGERIPGSFDASSGSLDAPGGLLDFRTFPHFQPVILNPTTGAVVRGSGFRGNDGVKKDAKAS